MSAPTVLQGRSGNCDKTEVFYADRPRYIYGVAIALTTLNQRELTGVPFTGQIADTSFAHCEEFARAYALNKDDTIEILREATCNLYDLHPSSFVYTLHRWPFGPDMEVRVYEVYFDDPLWVTDSFYLGISQYTRQHNGWDRYPIFPWYHWIAHPLDIAYYPSLFPSNNLTATDSECQNWDFYRNAYPDAPYGHMNDQAGFLDGGELLLMAYALIDSTDPPAPYIDPARPQPQDTTAIRHLRPLQRSVTVGPNPASEKLEVQSEHEISYIEVIDTYGQTVDFYNSRGTQCELDTRRLPSGIYFLHIFTSAGTVSKKVSIVH
jgi:hypothetical protein